MAKSQLRLSYLMLFVAIAFGVWQAAALTASQQRNAERSQDRSGSSQYERCAPSKQ